MTQTLHIDGDSITHRCGFSVEKTKYLVCSESSDFIVGEFDSHVEAKEAQLKWFNSKGKIQDTHEPGVRTQIWSRKEIGPEGDALALVDGVVNKIRGRFENYDLAMYLTPDRGNFRERYTTYAKYKGNRDGQKRPVHLKAILAHVEGKYRASYAKGEEADDTIGIAMCSNRGRGDVCVSNDKDLDQIVGTHFNWVKDEVYEVSPKQADLNFFSQVLSGDTADNVPGIYGMGPSTARGLVDGVDSARAAWAIVLEQYRHHYPSDFYERALETARLVRIRRTKDEIWSPPWEAVLEGASSSGPEAGRQSASDGNS